MKPLKILIQEYNFDLKLRSVYQKFGAFKLASELTKSIKTNDPEIFGLTTIFARDLYLGSDLTKKEKANYYKELSKAGFFKRLSTKLHAPILSIRSDTIYTIGKFSDAKMAIFLESAFENIYNKKDPILAARCLGELNWLNSKKVETYLKKLSTSEDLIAQLTLEFFYSMIADKNPLSKSIDKTIDEKWLWNFENCIFGIHSHLKLKPWTRKKYLLFFNFYRRNLAAIQKLQKANDYARIYENCFNK